MDFYDLVLLVGHGIIEPEEAVLHLLDTERNEPMPKQVPMKTVQICEHDACVVRCALSKRLKDVTAELAILRITQDRDLSSEERWQLPANLQPMPREELQEQINPWISLRDTIEYLIKEFKVEEPSL